MVDQMGRLRYPGHAAHIGELRNVRKLEGKLPLWRTSCSWEDNIKMD